MFNDVRASCCLEHEKLYFIIYSRYFDQLSKNVSKRITNWQTQTFVFLTNISRFMERFNFQLALQKSHLKNKEWCFPFNYWHFNYVYRTTTAIKLHLTLRFSFSFNCFNKHFFQGFLTNLKFKFVKGLVKCNRNDILNTSC